MKNNKVWQFKMLSTQSAAPFRILAASLLLVLAGLQPGLAQQYQSQERQGFLVTAALTNDPQWSQKMTQASVAQFDLASKITQEQPATMLIYFSNPLVRDGKISVTCTMEMRDSRRKVVGRLRPRNCFNDGPAGRAEDIYLFPVMELTSAHGTTSGPVSIEIGVTDEFRQQTVELSLTISVEKP